MSRQPHPPASPAPSPVRGGKPAPAASTAKARYLRSHMSEEEIILWSELRLSRKQGLHFRHQVPYGPYVLDFPCLKAKLAVEVDGEQHFHGDRPGKDAVRDCYLAERGVSTIRYTTTEIRKELDSVVTDIFRRAVERRFPPLAGEGGPKGRVG